MQGIQTSKAKTLIRSTNFTEKGGSEGYFTSFADKNLSRSELDWQILNRQQWERSAGKDQVLREDTNYQLNSEILWIKICLVFSLDTARFINKPLLIFSNWVLSSFFLQYIITFHL